MNEVSIIINGVRYDAVDTSKRGCVCHECDLEELCDNKLPDVETNRLSNSLDGFTSLMDKLSKENKTVNQETEPTGEVVEEQNKEEAIPLPVSSPLSPVANNLRSLLRDNKFKPICGEAANDYSKEIFRFDGNGEYLDVTITHSTCPKKE